jgi:hypothetical protein
MNWARKLAPALLLGACTFGLLGCGVKTGYAPVSGVITFNGKPMRNAVVMFLPEQTKENPNPGRGATGSTDETGHFALKTVDGVAGAAVGKNRVRILSKYDDQLHGYEVWDTTANKFVKSSVDPVPQEWNSPNPKKEFDVPVGGTDKANFDIMVSKGSKR